MGVGPGLEVDCWEWRPPGTTQTGLEAWLVTCGHTWCARGMKELNRFSFALSLLHCTSVSWLGLGGGGVSEEPEIFPPGTRVRLQLESYH